MIKSLTKWVYQNKVFTKHLVKEIDYGFVYKISNNETNEFYIGCKTFFSRTNVKISKKRANELYSGKGRKPTKEKKIKLSDWEYYKSSSLELREKILKFGDNMFSFEILAIFDNKQEMLCYEAYLILRYFLNKVPNILNKWVSIKSFKL